MSSGDIKESLVEQYPATRAADWKRTTKTKVGTFAVRVFTNANAKLDVVTIESADGAVMIVTVPAGADPIAMATTLTQGGAAASGVTVAPKPPKAPTNTTTPPTNTSTSSNTAAQSVAAKTNAAPNKKSLMKKGTKWRVTQDCDIYGWIDNPAFWDAVHKANAGRGRGQPRDETEIAKHPKSIKVVIAKLKAGTVMTVAGKMVADIGNHSMFTDAKTEGNGNGIPFSFKLGANELTGARNRVGNFFQPAETILVGDDAIIVPGYKFIEPFVELEGEATEQFIYLLRDKATGLFYCMCRYDIKDYAHNPEWDKWIAARDKAFPQWNGQWTQADQQRWTQWHEDNKFEGKYGHYFLKPQANPADYFEWEVKPTKAKQYADMGKMKTSILNFVGYHNGLQEETFSEDAGWMENIRHTDEEDDVGLPFLPTFEAVKMEKFTKREVEVIDLQAWYQRIMRLRSLTATYGSAVRALYNKLDKANELATNKYVVLFKSGKKDQWGDRTLEIDEGTMKGIEDTITQIGLKPKTVKRAKGPGSIAFAVENLSGAMGLKMGADDLVSVIIDLETMQELVA